MITSTARVPTDAAARYANSLVQVQDVLSRHLVRFGARRELSVEWTAGERSH